MDKTKESKWHGIKDELPDNNRMVLLFLDDGNYDFGYYSCGQWSLLIRESTITHWHELPKSPKKEYIKENDHANNP